MLTIYSSDSSNDSELSCPSDSDVSAFFNFFGCEDFFCASVLRGRPRPRLTPGSLLFDTGADFGLFVDPGLRPRLPLVVAPLLTDESVAAFFTGAADGSFRGRPRPRLTGTSLTGSESLIFSILMKDDDSWYQV